MKHTRKNAGFTLIELMIVVAIIAVVASIAIPKLMSARISANENAAIATLRSIASAQAQIQSACSIDTDADGGGEYAYFGELAGVAGLRFYDPGVPGQNIGVDPLDPSILPTAFGEVQDDGNDGIVERSGYYFKMFLPAPGAPPIAGLPESNTVNVGGAVAGSLPGADSCEILWACYAWPVESGSTGNRAFFINQEGDLLQTLNTGLNVPLFYDGLNSIPAFDSAYASGSGGADMAERMGITAMLVAEGNGETANDTNTWTVVGN
jgi:prepilin-type N-terminal cleavage/methylation domain-containing protein